MSDWRHQEATNSTIFREMNEWTAEAADTRAEINMETYVCECSDPRCTKLIRLTRAEYEAVRAVPIRFAIAVNHENPEIDRVVLEGHRFATIERFYGAEARTAWATNPRR
jgi:hypothetical protein